MIGRVTCPGRRRRRAPVPGRRGHDERPRRPPPVPPRGRPRWSPARSRRSGPARGTASDRLDEVPHRRGRREGDVVGVPCRLDHGRIDVLGDRLVKRHEVQLGAALPQRFGQDSRASAARASSTGRFATSKSRSDSTMASAIERSGTISARIPRSASAAAVPGPIAATVALASARASRPRRPERRTRAARRSGSSGRPAHRRAWTAPPRERPGSRAVGRFGLPALDHFGTQRPQRRCQAAGLGTRPRDDDAPGVQGTPLEPGDRFASRRHRARDHDRRRADAAAATAAGSSASVAVTVRWPAIVPRSTQAAGSPPSRPAATKRSDSSGSRFTPM